MGWFLNCAGRTALLTADEEIILGKNVQAWQEIKDQPKHVLTKEQKRIVHKGKKAYKRFFEANVRLIIAISKKYTVRITNLEMSDLVNEGATGLGRAIEKFDPTRGYKFSTYAYWWIKQAIERAIATSERTIRLPMHGNSAIIKLRKFVPQFIEQHGRRPNLAEMAEYAGVSTNILPFYLRHSHGVGSLDRPVNNYDRDSQLLHLKDLITDTSSDPYDAIALELSNDRFEALMDTLTDRERDILDMRYGLTTGAPSTYKDIGAKYGVTRQDIAQIEQHALNKILLVMQREKMA